MYALRKRWFKQEPVQTVNLPVTGLNRHVVIAGGGRVGQYVAQVLQRLASAFVIIEVDYRRVMQAKAKGFPVIYGDVTQDTVLEASQVKRASLVLITTPVIATTRSIFNLARHSNPTVTIVARAEGVEQMAALHGLGIYQVVQPEFEAGLEFTRQALLHLNISATDIQRFTDTFRRELYAPLFRGKGDYQALAHLQSVSHLLDLKWVRLL